MNKQWFQPSRNETKIKQLESNYVNVSLSFLNTMHMSAPKQSDTSPEVGLVASLPKKETGKDGLTQTLELDRRCSWQVQGLMK